MEDVPKELKQYFREVIAHPEGAVVHYGDCSVYSSRICDCGLLRTLMPMDKPDKWYQNYESEIIVHINKIEKNNER